MKINLEKIHIETIFDCNARCIFCLQGQPRPMGLSSRTINDKLFQKIVKECGKIPTLSAIKLSFNGESLLDKKIPERIRLIKSNYPWIKVSINTNALFLDKRMGLKLLNSGLDKINFHVSAATKSTYEKIMKELSFDRVLTNIIRFNNLVKQSHRDVEIFVGFVVNSLNFREIEIAKNFWLAKGIKFYTSDVMNRAGSVKEFDRLSQYPREDSKKDYVSICSVPFTQMFIRLNGDIVSCWNDWYNENVLGNCKKESLMGIWYNKNFKTLREGLLNYHVSSCVCSKCNVYKNYYAK